MTKEQFIGQLREIVEEPILLTDKTHILNEEIQTNEWGIALPTLSDGRVTLAEFQSFIQEVKQNRKAQLSESNLPVSLLWYSWVDFITNQFRFIVINSNHHGLRFISNVQIVDNERDVIDGFLYPSPKEISFVSLLDDQALNNTRNDVLKVYSEVIEGQELFSCGSSRV